MKHLKFLLAVVLAVCGMNTAKAEIVQNYVMDFNKSISFSAHDFKVASGWGHLVSYYHDSDTYCTASEIAVGPHNAECSGETLCVTFKPKAE